MELGDHSRIELSGRLRAATAVSCVTCATVFWKADHLIAQTRSNFCSNACRGGKQVKATTVKCNACGTPTVKLPADLRKSKSGHVFCSYKCAAKWRNSTRGSGEDHPNWSGGKASYRQRALKHYGAYCHAPGCPITVDIPEKMLDVDHIDGDRKNNKLSNLQVVCVWCHAIKTRALW